MRTMFSWDNCCGARRMGSGYPPASAAMKATASPATNGRCGSRVIWSPFNAATTCSSRTSPTAAAASPTLQARTLVRRGVPGGASGSEPPDLDLRGREPVRELIVGRLVEVADRLQARIEAGESRILEHRLAEVPISYMPRSKAEGKKIGLRDWFIGLRTFCRYGRKA